MRLAGLPWDQVDLGFDLHFLLKCSRILPLSQRD